MKNIWKKLTAVINKREAVFKTKLTAEVFKGELSRYVCEDRTDFNKRYVNDEEWLRNSHKCYIGEVTGNKFKLLYLENSGRAGFFVTFDIIEQEGGTLVKLMIDRGKPDLSNSAIVAFFLACILIQTALYYLISYFGYPPFFSFIRSFLVYCPLIIYYVMSYLFFSKICKSHRGFLNRQLKEL